MEHLEAIADYIETIKSTHDLTSLIVEGQPGWGKTHTVSTALASTNTEKIGLSSYSTPLNLYNFIAEHPTDVIVLDDCSGLFNDQNAMAILKAATWPDTDNKRRVSWGSTSGKAVIPEFEFHGKLIIICNSFPKTADGEAVKSRGLAIKVEFSVEKAKTLLLTAAKDPTWFHNTKVSLNVAEFLIKNLTETTISKISYRTLKAGYHLAEVHPNKWQELFTLILPKEIIGPADIVRKLANDAIQVKEQIRIFIEKTGLSERKFYNLRSDLGLSRTATN